MNKELQRTGASVNTQMQGKEQESAENWSLYMKYDCRGTNKELQKTGSCKKQ